MVDRHVKPPGTKGYFEPYSKSEDTAKTMDLKCYNIKFIHNTKVVAERSSRETRSFGRVTSMKNIVIAYSSIYLRKIFISYKKYRMQLQDLCLEEENAT